MQQNAKVETFREKTWKIDYNTKLLAAQISILSANLTKVIVSHLDDCSEGWVFLLLSVHSTHLLKVLTCKCTHIIHGWIPVMHIKTWSLRTHLSQLKLWALCWGWEKGRRWRHIRIFFSNALNNNVVSLWKIEKARENGERFKQCDF